MPDLRDAFSGPIQRIPTSPGYRLRLLAVLLGLLLLQALYLLLVAAVVYVASIVTLACWAAGMSLNALTLLLYLGPPAVGVIVTLFLLKPIVVRPPRPPKPLQLTPEQEPALFGFVAELCHTIGSPRPRRIYVNLDVNASAAVHGWRGLLFGDLDLTIGLPLAAGLKLPQFTGILAHEFGHFAQRAGLRSYYLIQTVHNWFARVVYQRDRFDHWLAENDGRDYRVMIVTVIAGAVVTASRKYLELLLKAGNFVSSAFSRQMEFDADRYEAAVCGCDAFELTTHQMHLLIVGATLAWDDAMRDFAAQRLPADVVALIAMRTECLPDDAVVQVHHDVVEQVTGRWDTHPCPSERIASARQSGCAGVLRLDGPASLLFRDLPALCRRATDHHYEKFLGVGANIQRVEPAETLLTTKSDIDGAAAVSELLGAAPESCIPWFRLPAAEPADAAPDSGNPPDAAAFDEVLNIHLNHFAARTVLQAGAQIRPEGFHLDSAEPDAVRTAEVASGRRLRKLVAQRNLAVQPAAARLASAAAGSDEYQAYCALSASGDDLLEIRRCWAARQTVRANGRLFAAAACANILDALEREARKHIHSIVERAAQVPSPVILNHEAPSLLGSQLVAPDSANDQAGTFLARFDLMAARTLGRLALLASACPAMPAGQGAE